MDAFCFLFLWSHMKSSLAENPIANFKENSFSNNFKKWK